MDKKAKYAILLVLVLGFLISNIVFAFKYKKYLLDNDGIFLEIKNSFEGKLIYSFELKPNCSSEEEILPLGKWDGFKEGCKCKNKIKDGPCTDDDLGNNCKVIKAKKPRIYTKINSNYICVKKSNITYIDLMKSNQILPKDKECPKNYIKCGIIDTLENILCIPNNETCPIKLNDIINKNNEINSTIDDQILSIFKLNENITPCIDPAEKTWRSYNILEEDKKCSTKIFGKLYDEKYEKIYIINTTKKNLYIDNSIIDFYDNRTSLEETIYLYARCFIGFKQKTIDKYYNNYKNLISKQKVPNISGLVLKIFACILLAIIIYPINEITECSLEPSDLICIVVIFIIVSILSFYIDFILCIIIYICSSDINSKLDIRDNDDYSNKLIEKLLDHYSINSIFSLINIIFCFPATIALIVGVMIIRKKCLKKDNKLEKNNENNSKENAQKNFENKIISEPTSDKINKLNFDENTNKDDTNNNNITTENSFSNALKIDNSLNNHSDNNFAFCKDIPVCQDEINKTNISKSVNVNTDEKFSENIGNNENNEKINIYKSCLNQNYK